MRSRYSAFCLRAEQYLLASWHPQTRPTTLTFDPEQRWLGLKIIACQAGGATDATGVVEFVARYKVHGKAFRLHESSRFSRVDDNWVYVDGEIDPPQRA
jgi:SEC-C motif-containing protein